MTRLTSAAGDAPGRLGTAPHARRRRAPAGFTIIELVIVLVILGVIAAIAVPQFTGLADRADEVAARALGSNIASATAANYGLYRLGGETESLVAVEQGSYDGIPELFSEENGAWDRLGVEGVAGVTGCETTQGTSSGQVLRRCTFATAGGEALYEDVRFSITILQQSDIGTSN